MPFPLRQFVTWTFLDKKHSAQLKRNLKNSFETVFETVLFQFHFSCADSLALMLLGTTFPIPRGAPCSEIIDAPYNIATSLRQCTLCIVFERNFFSFYGGV